MDVPLGNVGLAVYPRVCGGTERRRRVSGGGGGLSPRVRGNPLPVLSDYVLPGSIPACAGEPITYDGFVWLPVVYPRVCGGTP